MKLKTQRQILINGSSVTICYTISHSYHVTYVLLSSSKFVHIFVNISKFSYNECQKQNIKELCHYIWHTNVYRCLTLTSNAFNIIFYSQFYPYHILILKSWAVIFKIMSNQFYVANFRITFEGLRYLMPLLTIFQLYRGGQFYLWRKPEYPGKPTTNLKSLTNFIT